MKQVDVQAWIAQGLGLMNAKHEERERCVKRIAELDGELEQLKAGLPGANLDATGTVFLMRDLENMTGKVKANHARPKGWSRSRGASKGQTMEAVAAVRAGMSMMDASMKFKIHITTVRRALKRSSIVTGKSERLAKCGHPSGTTRGRVPNACPKCSTTHRHRAVRSQASNVFAAGALSPMDAALRDIQGGLPVANAAREHGVSPSSVYRTMVDRNVETPRNSGNGTKRKIDAIKTGRPRCGGCGSGSSLVPNLKPPCCTSCARRNGMIPPEKFSAVDSVGTQAGDNMANAG